MEVIEDLAEVIEAAPEDAIEVIEEAIFRNRWIQNWLRGARYLQMHVQAWNGRVC